jgi:hypothetical protein
MVVAAQIHVLSVATLEVRWFVRERLMSVTPEVQTGRGFPLHQTDIAVPTVDEASHKNLVTNAEWAAREVGLDPFSQTDHAR